MLAILVLAALLLPAGRMKGYTISALTGKRRTMFTRQR
jgi:hypothetical protein